MADVINFPAWVGETGIKYQAVQGKDIAEIAKLVRADIKSAIKAGQLPQGKYSVKVSRFSGGCSMYVRIADINVEIMNKDRIRRLKEGFDYYGAGPRYTTDGQNTLNTVKSIVNAYNYDRSDSQIDYFDVSFYSSVEFDNDFERNAEKLAEAALA